jgi:serine/threonine protein kinase
VNALLSAHDETGGFGAEFLGPEPSATRNGPSVGHYGTVVAGRYKLTEPIGEGCIGSAWLAEQKEPIKRQVALKLMKAGMDSRAVLARFEAEHQALAVMDHPPIARVFNGVITVDRDLVRSVAAVT